VKPLIVAWSVGGVLALLGKAIWQLAPYAWEIRHGLTPAQVAACAAWCAFMLFAEGYRGFQKAFSPRVVARAFELARNPRWHWVMLGPAYAMALVHARPRRLVVSWILLAGIVALVVLVRRIPQPWRGIVDAGVVLGLAWGAVSIVIFAVRAALGHAPEVDPGLPQSH
jgi:hypothetical protein